MFHFGFKADDLKKKLKECGFAKIEFFKVHTIDREGSKFPIFLVTAIKK